MSLIRIENEVVPKPNYKYITNELDAKSALSYIDKFDSYAIDTETTSLDPYEAKWTLLQVGVPGQNFVFDVRYDTDFSSINPKIFNPFFVKRGKLKILQNAAYDMQIIKVNNGIYLEDVYDTMLAEQLMSLGLGFVKANLASLVLKYTSFHMPKEPRETFKDYYQKFQDFQLEYAANDTNFLHEISTQQWLKIGKEGLENVADLEFRFLKPLCEMELNGITIDKDKWRIIMEDAKLSLKDSRATLYQMLSEQEDQLTLFGVPLVNIDSNAQLKKALLKYGFELENTSVGTLEKFKGHPLIDNILEYRKSSKLISTYADSLLAKISPYTQRLHTSFKQMIATGRMSSSNPNLQNIPRKQKYRSCFIAPEGYSLITADMSGAELRILGNLSQDPVFIDAYSSGQDLHTRTAAEVFSYEYNKVPKEFRTAAKAINFGLVYGMSAVGLSARLKITKKEAESMIDRYFKRYKGIKQYLDRSGSEAVKNRYSISVSGRKRYYNMPPYDHPDRKKIQGSIERQGKNMPIQGCLTGDVIVSGLGKIKDLVDRSIKIETGFGTDIAKGVYSGKKDVYSLKLTNGSKIGITLDHKVPVLKGDGSVEDVPVKYLNKDHYIRIPLKAIEGKPTDISGYSYEKGHWRETFVDYKYPVEMNKELSFIIGCLLGDGSFTKHNHFRFVCPEYHIELFNKFNLLIEEVFGYKPIVKVLNKNRSTPLYMSQVSSVVIRGFLKHIGLDYVKHRKKEIPSYFYGETIENKGALLNGLFSTDGGMTKESGPNFTNSSENLARGLHNLLFSLGINSNLKEYIEKGEKVYRLQVPKRFVNTFFKHIGFSVNEKQNSLVQNNKLLGRDDSIVPEFLPITVEKLFRKDKILYDTLSYNDKAHLRQFKNGKCSFTSLRKFINMLPNSPNIEVLKLYLKYDYCKVEELKYIGVEDTYDLMCKNIHYFIANGVIVHNSNADTIKEAMCLIVDRLDGKYDAKLILTVHDEVIVEAQEEQKYEVAKIVEQSIKDGFGRYFSLIPMETDALTGPCWLKNSCENSIDNKKCGSTEMILTPDTKYGTKLVCKHCGAKQD